MPKLYSAGALGHLALALVVAAPLLYAAASKFLDPLRFVEAIPRFSLSFLERRPRSARFVAALEGAAGASVVVLPFAVTGVGAGALYLVFVYLLVRARLHGSTGDCGCLGALPGGIDVLSIARSFGLAVASFGLAFLRQGGRLESYDLAAAAAFVIALTLAAAATDTILGIRQQAA